MAPVTPAPRPTPTPTTVAPATRPAATPAPTPTPRPTTGSTDTFQTTPTTRPTNAPVLQPTTTGNTPPTGTTTRPAPTPTTEAVTTTSSKSAAQRNGFPWISQIAPQGAGENFVNGEVLCGPAVFAMVARKIGFGKDLDDAALIEKLAEIGGTKPVTGTSMNGIVAMARAVGLPVDQTEAKFPGFDVKWMDEQLGQGKSIVANGALQTEDGPSGHYILVTGKDKTTGKYKINDPWSETSREMTEAQLGEFLKRNPVHKGASVALG